MKKLLFIIVVAFYGFNATSQNGFRTGVNLGIPTGGYSDLFSISANFELSYDWKVTESIKAGVITGINSFFGKDDNIGDNKYIPIAGLARVNLSDKFEVGADVGYAFSLESGGGGDFYWRPVLTFNINQTFDISASYNNVTGTGKSLSSFNLGFGFRF